MKDIDFLRSLQNFFQKSKNVIKQYSYLISKGQPLTSCDNKAYASSLLFPDINSVQLATSMQSLVVISKPLTLIVTQLVFVRITVSGFNSAAVLETFRVILTGLGSFTLKYANFIKCK